MAARHGKPPADPGKTGTAAGGSQTKQRPAKLLAECGYAENSPLEEALREHRETLYKELAAAVPEPRLIELFQLKYDYHNIKAILKAERRGISPEGLLLSGGRYDAERMQNEWHQEHRLTASDAARDAAEKAAALLRENDPQGADLVLDGRLLCRNGGAGGGDQKRLFAGICAAAD